MPIRIRLAVLFAAGTAAVFIVASIVFVHLLADGLRSSLDSGIQSRADLIAQSLPTASAGPGGLSPNLAVRGQGGDLIRFVQLSQHLSFRQSLTYLDQQSAPADPVAVPDTPSPAAA